MSKISGILASVAAAALAFGFAAAPAYAGDIVGLITKTNTNPFFVKMKAGLRGQGEGARPHAAGLRRQVRRRQRRPGRGDRAADGRRRQGHPAGAERLDRDRADRQEGARRRHRSSSPSTLPLDPADAADANIGTDNFKAGELIGEWAKATLGDKAETAKIATLDLAANQPSVDY